MKDLINDIIEVKTEVNSLLLLKGSDKYIGFTYTRGKTIQCYFVDRESKRVLNRVSAYSTGRELLLSLISIRNVLKEM